MREKGYGVDKRVLYELVSIPMLGKLESLNVSVACG